MSPEPLAQAVDAAARVAALLAARSAPGGAAVEVQSAGPGACALQMPLAGPASEGQVAALATTAGAAAATTLLPPDRAALTVEFKVNIIAHSGGEALRAHAQVVRAGKSIVVCRVEVRYATGGAEAPCATCLMTLMAAPT